MTETEQLETNLLLRRLEYLINTNSSTSYYKKLFNNPFFKKYEYEDVATKEAFLNKYNERSEL